MAARSAVSVRCVDTFVSERPADDRAREEVADDGKVDPAFIRPDVRDVGDPTLVGTRCLEVARELVRRDGMCRVGDGRSYALRRRGRREAHAAHAALYALLSDAPATSTQLVEHARAAVRLAHFREELADDRAELGIGADASAWWPVRMRVVALPGDAEEPAHRSDREGGLLRTDECESHSLSFAKKAAALRDPLELLTSDGSARRHSVGAHLRVSALSADEE